jgi:hypothetical protein
MNAPNIPGDFRVGLVGLTKRGVGQMARHRLRQAFKMNGGFFKVAFDRG